MTLAPETAIRAVPARSPKDVAALAAHLRRSVEPAVRSHQATPTTVEGRFLRRLVGALSAYEAAHGIMTPHDRHHAPSDTGGSLERQACPACGAVEFEAVAGAGLVRLRCRGCGACAEPGSHGLVLTDSQTCRGCDLEERWS